MSTFATEPPPTRRMDPEWKAKWLEALRSGKYKQGRQRLRTQQDDFCCLGVLADLVNPNGWSKVRFASLSCYGMDGNTCTLPHAVQRATGVSSCGEYASSYYKDGQYILPEELAKLNDDGADFLAIADVIEKHL